MVRVDSCRCQAGPLEDHATPNGIFGVHLAKLCNIILDSLARKAEVKMCRPEDQAFNESMRGKLVTRVDYDVISYR